MTAWGILFCCLGIVLLSHHFWLVSRARQQSVAAPPESKAEWFRQAGEYPQARPSAAELLALQGIQAEESDAEEIEVEEIDTHANAPAADESSVSINERPTVRPPSSYKRAASRGPKDDNDELDVGLGS